MLSTEFISFSWFPCFPSVLKPAIADLALLILHSPLTSPVPSSYDFKGSYDYIWPTRLIQDNYPNLKLFRNKSLIHNISQVYFCSLGNMSFPPYFVCRIFVLILNRKLAVNPNAMKKQNSVEVQSWERSPWERFTSFLLECLLFKKKEKRITSIGKDVEELELVLVGL